MANDNVEEISIEETNALRLKLGLKPLRTAAPPPPPEPTPKPAAKKDSGDGESISIEETNQLRIAMGLKPLKVDSTTSKVDEDDNSFDAQERRAAENWKKHQAEEERKKRRLEIKEQLRKGQEKAERERKLEGKGLADDSGDDDAKAWIKGAKKRQKKALAQIEKDLREREEEEARLRKDYTSKDLAGLKVGHDLGELGEDVDGTILTLKDSEILGGDDEEGDELENAGLVESAKLKERLDLKKRKPDYNPYGDDEDADGEILSKYDDEIDPKKKRKFFVLDDTGSTAAAPPKSLQRQQAISEKLKKIPISLDILNPAGEDQSDYIDPSTIKVKKPKKKKARTQRRVAEEDDDIFLPEDVAINGSSKAAGTMDIDSTTETKPKKVFEQSFVDDEDLSAALAIQRRAALKKQKALKPEELAKKLREEAAEEMRVDEEEAPGLVIDETTEFVGSLQLPVHTDRRPRAPSVKAEAKSEPSTPGADGDGDVAMGSTDFGRSVSPQVEAKKEAPAEITSTGLEEETTIGVGVGAMLAMLRQRQLVDAAMDPETHRKMQEKEAFLAKQRVAKSEAELKAKAARERDRKSGKFDKMSAREKEEYARYENKLRDTHEAREAAARFKDYKPDVKIEHKDEYGRTMNQKEAFKYLSHQFHGKGSGKQKTEKKLKKIEDDKKRMAASSLNPEGLVGTIADTAKKSRTAGVRLM
ncbi:hypothetical protein TWF106_009067 [Orbilia oligospora]|uniref:Uncharacterized protein n=1 Tax=Orbilia oligospora TaxID=2813651 RepID=A0A6G1LWE2_ORBOL|nr:hypothetical protein TWF788_008430 [Orbilia oligospora]KAF3214376.1 hypothetical protein TWF106_009067 [Orbilia oligospora]KAF3224940.1 hypothetical protein TWF191_005789 [Orbilia oligospora]KAF3236327.1 hypothetical protein TWF192_011463 [Orbilia oligospora]